MVKEKLLRLIQKINFVGSSFPMLYIKLDFVEKMELESDKIPIFKTAIKKIEKLACKALKNIEDYNALLEIKNTYSEAYIFSKLSSILVIEKISEQNSKTPDFKVKYKGKDIFIELKSLNMLGGTLKHKKIMTNSLDSKIEAEEQIRNGAKVGFGETEIQPYLSFNKPYNPMSVRLVTESFIDKIRNNIEKDQYSPGDTILLVDLSDQLPLISQPSQAIQEKYFDEMGGSVYVSGELWHVAFGEKDKQIYKPTEFEGADNRDGLLSKEGILKSYSFIKGLIFHINNEFYSLGKIEERNIIVIQLLEYVSKKHSFESKI